MAGELRLVVWNCAQALHAKWHALLALKPDIAIVPECAHPDVIRRKAPDFNPTTSVWEGWNRHKGLGAFSFGAWTLTRSVASTDRFSIFLPLEVAGTSRFRILAIWAFNHRAPVGKGERPPTTFDALSHYADFLSGGSAIAAGDFNANVLWDKSGKYPPFQNVHALLDSLGFQSVYHRCHGELLGEESRPTLLWQRNVKKPYHVDYCYYRAAHEFISVNIAMGKPEEWVRYSDHTPMVVTIAGW